MAYTGTGACWSAPNAKGTAARHPSRGVHGQRRGQLKRRGLVTTPPFILSKHPPVRFTVHLGENWGVCVVRHVSLPKRQRGVTSSVTFIVYPLQIMRVLFPGIVTLVHTYLGLELGEHMLQQYK